MRRFYPRGYVHSCRVADSTITFQGLGTRIPKELTASGVREELTFSEGHFPVDDYVLEFQPSADVLSPRIQTGMCEIRRTC